MSSDSTEPIPPQPTVPPPTVPGTTPSVASATTARRFFDLIEPIHAVAYSQDPTDELLALGLGNYWDGYFAGRAAPLGTVPAEVVHAVFYNFAPGEVARHIPRVWRITTPEAALAARQRGCVKAIRRAVGDAAEGPAVARAADLATRAAQHAPSEGRILSSALRTLPVPEEPVARLWHSITVLREHRGDGHNAALLAAGIGGTEAHVLLALSVGLPAAKFGRVHHLPATQLDEVIDGMRARGLIDGSGWLSDEGQRTRAWVEARTDALAAPAYEILSLAEQDQLAADLTPIAAAIQETEQG